MKSCQLLILMAARTSNPELYYFRCSLLKVSQKLRTENLRELVYICTEIKSTEHITKGHDLFLDLEKKGLIMPGNYDYLLDRLLQIGREDIATYLLEYICHPHTQWDVSNKMLDCLLKAGRDEVALYFMKWMWKSLHAPSTFAAHMEHLINSGRGDLVMELMGCRAVYTSHEGSKQISRLCRLYTMQNSECVHLIRQHYQCCPLQLQVHK